VNVTEKGKTSALPFQIEADGFARLSRVHRILAGEGLIQSWHPHENYPDGMSPSTTLPLDLAILSLYAPSMLFTEYPLDWAGALVSPILFVLLFAYLAWFSRGWLDDPTRLLLLAGIAGMPALAFATAFARADHQSLLLFLITVALTAEWRRWDPAENRPSRWGAAAGITWGLALWTSLYEPVFFVAIILLANWIARRQEQWPFLISLGATLVSYAFIEGFHISWVPPGFGHALEGWWGTIPEMQPAGFQTMLGLLSPVIFLLPLYITRLYLKGELRIEHHVTVGLLVMCLFQFMLYVRWQTYASLLIVLVAVLWFATERLAWLRWTGLFLSVLLVTLGNVVNLAQSGNFAPTPHEEIRRIARAMDSPGAILAPWWQSPELGYLSGQPIVAGSSHMTLPGIVDAARFFTATKWPDADEILQRRKVRWVVIWSPTDLLAKMYPITGESPPNFRKLLDAPIALRLMDGRALPTRYQLRAVTPHFRLYEYVP
jgi:hypothetical protein